MTLELPRRAFLGGMLSLLAATAIEATPLRLVSNRLPRIHGNGKDYDSEGFQALFDGKEIIFPKDKLIITEHKGVIVHGGQFVINREVWTERTSLHIEAAIFDGRLLESWEYFFTMRAEDAHMTAANRSIKWQRTPANGLSVHGGYIGYNCAGIHAQDQTRFRPKSFDEDFEEQLSMRREGLLHG